MSARPDTTGWIRHSVTLIFVLGYFLFLFGVTGMLSFQGDGTVVLDLEENPVITLLLGIMSSALMLIVQFYYRRGTPQ